MLDVKAVKEIVAYLKSVDYAFVTITPDSHNTVLGRDFNVEDATLRDIFGWNRPFSESAVAPALFAIMQRAQILLPHAQGFKSALRVSSLNHQLYVHSAFPTQAQDAVFFGPDSYRYARLLMQSIAKLAPKKYRKILDIGAGSGVGGIVAARAVHHQYESLCLSDINPKALEFSKLNVETSATPNAQFVMSNLYDKLDDQYDLIISNPPYLVDTGERAYRHGGGDYGSLLSTKIVLEGLPRLANGGVMILYTASAIVDGQDLFLDSLAPIVRDNKLKVSYEEIDPDVFGEELRTTAYQKADRIAVVSVVIEKLDFS